MAEYRVLAGINYTDADGEEKRAEADEIVDDLPEDAVEWLLASEIIEDVNVPDQTLIDVVEGEGIEHQVPNPVIDSGEPSVEVDPAPLDPAVDLTKIIAPLLDGTN